MERQYRKNTKFYSLNSQKKTFEVTDQNDWELMTIVNGVKNEYVVGHSWVKDQRQTQVKIPGAIEVKTLFRGYYHAKDHGSKFTLFDTVTVGLDPELCLRTETWEKAERYHQNTIEMIIEANEQKPIRTLRLSE